MVVIKNRIFSPSTHPAPRFLAPFSSSLHKMQKGRKERKKEKKKGMVVVVVVAGWGGVFEGNK